MSDADPNGESIAPEHIWPSKWQAKLSSFNLNVLNAWGGIPRLISRSRMWPEGLFPYIAGVIPFDDAPRFQRPSASVLPLLSILSE